MQTFDIVRKSNPTETFRVKSIIGKFDLQQAEAVEHFKGSIDLPEKWNIGLIVGHSGTGKSTIARELFGDRIFKGFDYTHDNILDDMPQDVEVNEIAKTLTAVGFSSPPLLAETLSRSIERREDALRHRKGNTYLQTRDVRVRRVHIGCRPNGCADILFCNTESNTAQGRSVCRCNLPRRCAGMADARLDFRHQQDEISSSRLRGAKKKSDFLTNRMFQNRQQRVLLEHISEVSLSKSFIQ